MSAERQQGKPYQRSLVEGYEEGLRHDSLGNGGTGSGPLEESQTPTASDPARALTERLMEEVCQRRVVGVARPGQPRSAVCEVASLKETAGYAKYVRWCGRTGAAKPPPTRFHRNQS
jgi:hypothetical protein